MATFAVKRPLYENFCPSTLYRNLGGKKPPLLPLTTEPPLRLRALPPRPVLYPKQVLCFFRALARFVCFCNDSFSHGQPLDRQMPDACSMGHTRAVSRILFELVE